MNGTILLADDSLTIQKVVELTFADTDHTVIAVSSGDELLEKLPSVRPDVIICDVLMPGTDGYAVCQSIKSDPQWLHVPVVLLTGTFEPFDRDRAIAAGCNEIITKPFEARKLVETVENLLSQGAAPAQEREAPAERFEGAVAPPAHEGAFEGPAGEPYGTVLAPPPGGESAAPATGEDAGEGLDFTTSGFDAMRAAGEAPESFPETVPDEGLEFEPGTPPAKEDAESPFPASDVSAEPFAPVSDEEIQRQEAAFEFGQAGETPGGAQETAAAEATGEPPDRPATMPMERPDFAEIPGAAETPSPLQEGPAFLEEVQEVEVEAVAPAAEKGEDFDSPSTEPVVGPTEMKEAPPEPVTPPAEPVAASPEPAALEPPAESVPVAPALSDEDVERIARRVVELAAGRLEQIAWEVIPDMAELVVRERIRELEAEAEREDATH
ncbi:MAG: response regulator [Acidobacteria bacterium]|nr:response regulator [Acidobacteriota bacterium]